MFEKIERKRGCMTCGSYTVGDYEIGIQIHAVCLPSMCSYPQCFAFLSNWIVINGAKASRFTKPCHIWQGEASILWDREGGSIRYLRNEVDILVFESPMTSRVPRTEHCLSKCGLNTPVFVMAKEYKKRENLGTCP